MSSSEIARHLAALQAKIVLVAERVGLAEDASGHFDGLVAALPSDARSFVVLLLDNYRHHGESESLRRAAEIMMSRVLLTCEGEAEEDPHAAPPGGAATRLH